MTTTLRRLPERIAVGVDGSVASHAAVRWAITHARSGDTVTLVYVWQPSPVTVESVLVDPNDDSAAQRVVDRELSRTESLPRDLEVTISSKAIRGSASDSLGSVAADLLVVGAGRHGRLVGAVLGSVSAHLLRHSHVPVVIVPTPGAGN